MNSKHEQSRIWRNPLGSLGLFLLSIITAAYMPSALSETITVTSNEATWLTQCDASSAVDHCLREEFGIYVSEHASANPNSPGDNPDLIYLHASEEVDKRNRAIYKSNTFDIDFWVGWMEVPASVCFYASSFRAGYLPASSRHPLNCYNASHLTCKIGRDEYRCDGLPAADSATVSGSFSLPAQALNRLVGEDDVVISIQLEAANDGAAYTEIIDRRSEDDRRFQRYDVLSQSRAVVAQPPNDLNYADSITAVSHTSGKLLVGYLGEWSVYGRNYRFAKNFNHQYYTHVVHSFLGICSSDALTDVNNGLGQQTIGSEFENAANFYGNTCTDDDRDGTLRIVDDWASLQMDLGAGGYSGAASDATEADVRGLFGEYIRYKKLNPSLKVLASIGGWSLSDSFRHLTGENKDQFLASLEAFLRRWTFFDGVDIDWETPQDADEGRQFVELLRDVREVLDRLEDQTGREYELSSAVFSGKRNIDLVDYEEATQYLDYVFAMTYDYHGAFSDEIGFHSNLFSKDQITQENSVLTSIRNFIDAGVPKEKLLLGASSYGRSVTLGDKADLTGDSPLGGVNTIAPSDRGGIGTFERGVMEWHDVYNRFWPGNPELEVTMENVEIAGQTFEAPKVNGYYYITDGTRNSDFFYNPNKKIIFDTETPRTASNKASLALLNDLAGVFFWVLEYDNGLIATAIHDGLRNTIIDPGYTDPDKPHQQVTYSTHIAQKGGSSLDESQWTVVTGNELDIVPVVPMVPVLLELNPKSTYGDCCGDNGGTANLPVLSAGQDLEFKQWNGNWAKNIVLPSTSPNGGKVTLISNAGWASNVKFDGHTTILKKGMRLVFVYSADSEAWVPQQETIINLNPKSDSGDCCGGNGGTAQLPALPEDFTLEFRLWNGNWAENIELPSSAVDGAKIRLISHAGWASNVKFNGYTAMLKRGMNLVFVYSANSEAWVPQQEIVISLNPQSDFGDCCGGRGGTAQLPALPEDFTLEFKVWDGNWAKNIELPSSAADGAKIRLISTAAWASKVKFAGYTATLKKGMNLEFVYSADSEAWVPQQEIVINLNPKSSFGDCCGGNGNTSQLPALPAGFTLEFTQWNGNWARNIELPSSAADGAKIRLMSRAGWASNVLVNGGQESLVNGNVVVYIFNASANQWEKQ